MKKLLLASLLFFVSACGHTERTVWSKPPASDAENAYREALAELEDGSVESAVTAFHRLKLKYPYAAKWSTLADLRIADAFFKDKQYPSAASAYQDFIKSYPTHAEVPYALFMNAECYYEAMPSDFFILPSPSQRELKSTRQAQSAYLGFLSRYPEDRNATLASKRLKEIESRLSEHEIYAAEYYFKNDSYLGAANRAETILKEYPNSSYAPKAAILSANAHIHLKDPVTAKARLNELIQRYPESKEAEQARQWIKSYPDVP